MIKKILIVDDHFIVRSGMTLLLESEIENVEVSDVDDFPAALNELEKVFYDLIILDINLPGGKKLQMIEDLRQLQKDVKILMFSAHEEDIYPFRYMQSGADGYLNKLSDSSIIVGAVKDVLKGNKYISSDIIDKFIAFSHDKNQMHNPFDVLTYREIEIASLFAKGYGNLEVANELDIKMTTVSTHKLHIFKKLDISNVIELAELFKKYS